jgi:hypothetical protein
VEELINAVTVMLEAQQKGKKLQKGIVAVGEMYDGFNTIVHKSFPAGQPREIAEIVNSHSQGAAAAAVASAWIPGAGGTAAVLASAGFIWAMYARIGSVINLPLSENILKTLGSGVATNLASGMAASWVLSSVFSFFPGIGSIPAVIIMGGTCYSLTFASGFVYIKLMTALFNSGLDPTEMSEQELKNKADEVANSSDVKDVMNKAKQEYKS